ncbi:MAG: metal-dependent hydrolase [Sulfolobales archaeon]
MNRAAHIILGVGVSIFIISRLFPTLQAIQIPLIVLGGGIGSVFPDLDRRRGHRKILHNIFFLVFFSSLFFIASLYLKIPMIIPTSFFLGYLSHLLGDMMTYRGVALLYPFKSNYYRSPLVIGRSEDLGVNVLGIVLGVILMFFGITGSR